MSAALKQNIHVEDQLKEAKEFLFETDISCNKLTVSISELESFLDKQPGKFRSLSAEQKNRAIILSKQVSKSVEEFVSKASSMNTEVVRFQKKLEHDYHFLDEDVRIYCKEQRANLAREALLAEQTGMNIIKLRLEPVAKNMAKLGYPVN